MNKAVEELTQASHKLAEVNVPVCSSGSSSPVVSLLARRDEGSRRDQDSHDEEEVIETLNTSM